MTENLNDVNVNAVEADQAVADGVALEVAPSQKRRGRPVGSKNGQKAQKPAQISGTLTDGDTEGLLFAVSDGVAVFYNGNSQPQVALTPASPYSVEFLAGAVALVKSWPVLDNLRAADALADALHLSTPDRFKVWQYAAKHSGVPANADSE